ncbi:dephospho-CoA kinase [Candidatus Electronema sp. PJ]|uniref:dephospho-CoA kinase n=1 Tax=Candidatus Electronema sp. PJ TaxID=3401572 RepID=UPI003AA988BC
MPKIVGITGGIGSGKSLASRYLAALGGWPLLDLDQICRQLLLPQAPGWLALQKLLPEDFFADNDELNRPKLRQAIFANVGLRHQLDSLLHPLARQEMATQVAGLTAPLVLAEIPLLYEAGWQDSLFLTVVIYAKESVRLRRIIMRDQVTEKQAHQAIAAQMSLEEKARLADYLIDNSGDWSRTCGQLQQLAKKMHG